MAVKGGDAPLNIFVSHQSFYSVASQQGEKQFTFSFVDTLRTYTIGTHSIPAIYIKVIHAQIVLDLKEEQSRTH
jgi:hypothetical protein